MPVPNFTIQCPNYWANIASFRKVNCFLPDNMIIICYMCDTATMPVQQVYILCSIYTQV